MYINNEKLPMNNEYTYIYIYIFLLGSKTLGTKCIRTSLCIRW